MIWHAIYTKKLHKFSFIWPVYTRSACKLCSSPTPVRTTYFFWVNKERTFKKKSTMFKIDHYSKFSDLKKFTLYKTLTLGANLQIVSLCLWKWEHPTLKNATVLEEQTALVSSEHRLSMTGCQAWLPAASFINNASSLCVNMPRQGGRGMGEIVCKNNIGNSHQLQH